MNWCNGDNWSWGGSFLMTAGIVVFWALVIAAVAFAVRYLVSSAGPSPGSRPDSAESLLAERYARGEIDDAEYQRQLMVLREHR